MKRFLAFLAPWMVATMAWAQAQTSLSVEYTYKGVFADRGARVDEITYVTPSLFRRIGWTIDINNGVMNVLAEGRTFQLQSKIIGDARLYPLDEALRYIGATASYEDDGKKIIVRGQVRSFEKTETGFRIDSTTNLLPRAFRLSNPDRFVVDLNGANLESKDIKELPAGWRITQQAPGIVRIVIESPAMATQQIPNLEEGRVFEVAMSSTEVQAKPVQILAQIGSPTASTETANSVSVVIPLIGTTTQVPGALFLDPTTIQISIPGSSAGKTGTFEIEKNRFVSEVNLQDDGKGTSTVHLKLSRPMAFQVSAFASGVKVTLTAPKAGNGSGLAGKVIVVDAGHGGKDTGAVHYGVQEKQMTLAMAKAVSSRLINAGASVVMTRSDDTFIPLNERPGLANRIHADLFISCHFNSNSVDESRSGTIMFYHKGDSMDMLLAECLRHEIGKVSGLPELGSWSDGRIYQSGFAVLRGATMPGVLMELGFLNHSKDRGQIQKQEFRDNIADAVVAGVKEFFNDGKK